MRDESRDEHDLSTWQTFVYPGARPFLGLFLLDGVADIGWWVALGAFAGKDGVWAVGSLAVASILAALIMLPAGPAIDDNSPSRVLAVTTAMKVVLVGGLGLATLNNHAAPVVPVVVVAIGLGAIDGFHLPALDAVLTDLLPANAQEAGVGMERLTTRAAQAIAGILVGALVSTAVPTSICLVSALLWLLGLPLIRRVQRAAAAGTDTAAEVSATKSTQGRRDAVKSWVKRTLDGLQFIGQHPVLRLTIPAQSVFNLSTAGLSLIGFPLLAAARGWRPGASGWLFGAWGVGLAAGTVIAMTSKSPVQNKRPGAAMGLIALVGLMAMLLTTGGSFVVHLGLVALMGIASGPIGVWLTGLTRRQAKGQAKSATIISVSTLALVGVEFVGLAAAAAVDAIVGAGLTFVIVGGFIMLLGIIGASHPSLWHVTEPDDES